MKWIFWMLCLALPATALAEEPVMRVEQVVESGPAGTLQKTDEVTTWIGQDFVRIESRTRVHILDARHDVYTVVRKDQGTYWQATKDQLVSLDLVSPTALLGLGVGDDGGPHVATPAFEKTGANKNVPLGSCEEWQSTEVTITGGRSRLCMAPVGVDWADLQSVAERVFTVESSRTRAFFTQAKSMSGFPIETRLLTRDGEVRHTVRSVERVSADAGALTRVSSDYQRVRGPAGF